jgi:hypothetical protein
MNEDLVVIEEGDESSFAPPQMVDPNARVDERHFRRVLARIGDEFIVHDKCSSYAYQYEQLYASVKLYKDDLPLYGSPASVLQVFFIAMSLAAP